MTSTYLFPGPGGVGLACRVDSILELPKVHEGGGQASKIGDVVKQQLGSLIHALLVAPLSNLRYVGWEGQKGGDGGWGEMGRDGRGEGGEGGKGGDNWISVTCSTLVHMNKPHPSIKKQEFRRNYALCAHLHYLCMVGS